MATNVNRVPHNSMPEEWAFHPTIGPFMREFMNIVWQTRNRSGGDEDSVAGLDSRVEALESLILDIAPSYGNSVEIDFGSQPVYDAAFTITDASIDSGSVVVVSPGGAATGRTADDWQWDGATVGIVPSAGSASCYVTFHPGPVVGRRKFNYLVV